MKRKLNKKEDKNNIIIRLIMTISFMAVMQWIFSKIFVFESALLNKILIFIAIVICGNIFWSKSKDIFNEGKISDNLNTSW